MYKRKPLHKYFVERLFGVRLQRMAGKINVHLGVGLPKLVEKSGLYGGEHMLLRQQQVMVEADLVVLERQFSDLAGSQVSILVKGTAWDHGYTRAGGDQFF